MYQKDYTKALPILTDVINKEKRQEEINMPCWLISEIVLTPAT